MIALNLFSSQASAGTDVAPLESGELDWRGAYLRVQAQEPAPLAAVSCDARVPDQAPQPRQWPDTSEVMLQPELQQSPWPVLPQFVQARPSQPDARPAVSAVSRAEAPEPQSPAVPQPSLLPRVPQLPPEPSLAPTPQGPTVTVQRIEALLSQQPLPPSRVWQVELSAAQPGWQLRVEQLQPQAPLRLDLSVPAALQPQARRQLAELDKRLREAGHDVLGVRLHDSPRVRRQRVDEVPS
ncbi:hypothetical protein [Roseateles asaccharophilus]|uniref:Flagellar hook-length control protein FliK n=1 Tax=Roseateles asaccharophilus TaxID=582607 RepID=A0ABU2A876_9BURK|nr:hypothetical protein [Roseateles asaccharophilus]MDR7333394.1 hypothetical protein [Roseateles asaccharophilus]